MAPAPAGALPRAGQFANERARRRLIGDEVCRRARTLNPGRVVAALGKKVSPRTPRLLPAGSLALQPTEERRRSGSHYTPRSLTQPIVKTTLDPIVDALGDRPAPDRILGLKVCDPAMGSGAFLVEACRYLGEKLVKAWDDHQSTPPVPPDEDPLLHARRLVAQKCLYGVDKNPFAVDLAKLSLWLATLAKDHPFTFLDDSLRHGDSLVGLSPDQISRFHWEPKGQVPLVGDAVRDAQARAIAKRAEIETLNDDDVDRQMELLAEAEAAVADVRLAGDLVIAAFFGGAKEKEREALRKRHEALYLTVVTGKGDRAETERIAAQLREGEKPVFPLHWELEFPEVFVRENPGFDAFVGNPPFLGGKRVSTSHGDNYRDWLAVLHEASSSNADLVAHFFRRAFAKLRQDGSFGLVATNTISQGDSRTSALTYICTHGGTIFSARRRLRWPGTAAVVVSVVHITKGPSRPPFCLDDRDVALITSYLFHAGGHPDPSPLPENAAKSYIGVYILGTGFTFDDTNPQASPLSEMERLLASNPRNAERVFTYLGGEELNTSPTHRPHRYAIDFGAMDETAARDWPDLMAIVETRVRPERDSMKRDAHRLRWWQYGDKRPELTRKMKTLDRVLVTSRVSQHLAFAYVPTTGIIADSIVVIALSDWPTFSILQSRAHETWARFFASSLEDRLRYTPSDCFETFPFPAAWHASAALESSGKTYYDFRATSMVRSDEGLTKTYNRFHDPDETSSDILRLRTLHDEMDRAVLDAYGWTDLRPTCAFILDYEDEDTEDDDPARARKRKKPWRYRWPDDIRDEVLARLLVLNTARASLA